MILPTLVLRRLILSAYDFTYSGSAYLNSGELFKKTHLSASITHALAGLFIDEPPLVMPQFSRLLAPDQTCALLPNASASLAYLPSCSCSFVK